MPLPLATGFISLISLVLLSWSRGIIYPALAIVSAVVLASVLLFEVFRRMSFSNFLLSVLAVIPLLALAGYFSGDQPATTSLVIIFYLALSVLSLLSARNLFYACGATLLLTLPLFDWALAEFFSFSQSIARFSPLYALYKFPTERLPALLSFVAFGILALLSRLTKSGEEQPSRI